MNPLRQLGHCLNGGVRSRQHLAGVIVVFITMATVAAGRAASPQIFLRAPLFKPNEPIEVDVKVPNLRSSVSLLLLDERGMVLGSMPVSRSGTVDVAAGIPALRQLTQAVYLQLMEDDQPTGSAIVVQPLRSRPPVRTTRDTRSDGKTPFTRIIGWGPTLLRPDNADDVKLSESWLEGDALITSGYRLYPETDALLETDRGNMTIAFCHSEAPNTVANFTRLAQEGFYDGTTFHRIVGLGRDGFPFVIQGGDPTGTGEGGPGWDLPIEPSSLPHDFGVISMARADEPDSAGSQFFLCLSREGTARLDGQYCAFGYLTAGAETMLGISQVQVADIATGRPSIATSIPKVRMIPSSSHVALEDRRGRRLTAPATTTSPPAVPR